MKKYLFIIIFLVVSVLSNAQQVMVSYDFADSLNTEKNDLSLQKNFPDEKTANEYLRQLPQIFSSKGFMAASIDSIIKKDSAHLVAKIFLGEKYFWRNLTFSDSVENVFHSLGYKKNDFINKPYDKFFFDNLVKKIIDYYSEQGFPFAKAGLQNVQLEHNYLSGTLFVDKGYIYNLDSIIISGNAQISEFYLLKILDIQLHEPYNAKKLADIDRKLSNLTFVQQTHPWELKMTSEGAVLYLFLDKKSVNEIDAIIGFNAGENSLDRKLRLNGQVRMNLRNAFGGGEFIGFDWQQLRAQSPRLDLAFSKPYLFRSPFGVEFGLNIYKYDSSFVNINGTFGVSYALSTTQQLKLFVNAASTRMLSVDTAVVKITKTLPTAMDLNNFSGEIVYQLNNTDYIINPRKGSEINISFFGGSRKIKPNNAILQLQNSEFNYANLYDTVKLNTYQIKSRVYGAHYFPVGKQSVLKTAVNAGLIYAPSYYLNELFQLGGYRLLRGFNEESIFANQFAVATLEYRLLFAQNSYFFGFSDGGWRQFKVSGQSFNNAYISAGLGMAFQTKAGIFNITLANGKTSGEPFRFNQSKVHVGYTALF